MQEPVVIWRSSSWSNCAGSTTTWILLMVEPSLSAMKSTAFEERWVRTHPATVTSWFSACIFRASAIFTLFIIYYLYYVKPIGLILLVCTHAETVNLFLC